MGKKRKNEAYKDLYKLTTLQVYDYVVNGYIPRFPPNFVTKENMKIIMREVILNRVKLTRKDICKNLTYDYLRKYKLRGARRAFDDNLFNLISYCFPEMKIKYWELNKVEDGFWYVEENRRAYMKWLIEKENIDPSKLSELKRITSGMIDRNHGRRVREAGGGVYNLVLLIAQIDVKEWQILNIAHWTEEKAKCALKWLFEEKLKWSYEEIAEKINSKVFFDNGLGGLYSNYFKHNTTKVINYVYPGKFRRLKNKKIEVVY